ncbi:hypothetical protein Q757_04185 [Oenococcus alcoholitolerans]|uniref:Pyruvate carboxyltransferase domain-containing protein n=1 Tax=Oenococcus alcoholitolerans TaxID=931074 RepID=A0ABR4XR14_9LACO|nr:hypothetical protein Q757_04185 [Oenococcus alcoholitolerans]
MIEAGFPRASNEDLLAVKEVSKVVKSAAVTGLARLNQKDIDAAVESVAEAGRPMIHLFIATSPVHRESKLHMNKEQILDKIAADVDYARKRMPYVIFLQKMLRGLRMIF